MAPGSNRKWCELVRAVAHGLNQDLTVILSAAEVLQQTADEEERLLLAELRGAAGRCARVAAALLRDPTGANT